MAEVNGGSNRKVILAGGGRGQFTSALSHNYLSAVSIGTQQFLLATSEIL